MRNTKNWFGLKCKLKMCGCVTESDSAGNWAKCLSCGNKFAYISHKVMHSYIELCEAIEKHRELSEKE